MLTGFGSCPDELIANDLDGGGFVDLAVSVNSGEVRVLGGAAGGLVELLD